MYKQQQYNAGVDAIDSARTSIANLPVDSKYANYVQGALSSLDDSIKKVSGSDFSNLQLVNQITGAAKTIAYDPIVQNGIVSAQVDKQNRDQMQEDRKNGKLAVENQWDYQNQYAKWKQDPDLSNPFNGSYSTYIDVNKKWMDILKMFDSTANVEDVPFETDANGNIDYTKIATAMTEKGYKGASPDQLKAAIQSSLSDDDLNQMRISANYRFRNYSPSDLQSIVSQSYDNSKSQLLSRKKDIEQQLKLYPETTDVGSKLKQSLDYINDQLGDVNNKGKLDIQRDNQLKWISNNPDEAKFQIYKNGAIDQFSNAFSYLGGQSTKYLESPYTKYNEWMQDYNQRQYKQAYSETQDKISNSFREREVLTAEERLKFDEGKVGNGMIGDGFTTTLGIPTAQTKTALQSVSDVGTNAFQQADSLKADLADKLTSPGESKADALKNIDGLIAQYQNGTLDSSYSNIKPQLQAIIKASSTGANISAYLQGVDKEADNQLKSSPEYRDLLNQISSRHSLKVGNYTYTPMEVMDLISKEHLITTPSSPTTGTGGTSFTDVDQSTLSAKEKVLASLLQGVRYGQGYGGIGNTQQKIMANSYVTSLEGLQQQYSGILKRKNDIIENYLQTRSPIFQAQSTALNVSSKTRDQWWNMVNPILNDRITKDNGGNTGLDLDEAKKMILGGDSKMKTEDTRLSIIHQPGQDAYLSISNGTKNQLVRLTQDEAAQFLPVLQNQNQDLATRLSLTRGLSTNYLGTPEGALFQRGDFPNVKNTNVTADLMPANQLDDKGNPTYYLLFNTQINGKWRKLQLNSPVSYDKAQTIIQSATDETLMNTYK